MKNEQFKPKRGQVPTNLCQTCNHCTSKYCMVHKRHIEPDYNRCFFHSTYQPNITTFKVNPKLENIMKQEQELESKRHQGWLIEHNKMVEDIRKDIALSKEFKRKSA